VEYAKTTSVITVQRNFRRQFEVDPPDNTRTPLSVGICQRRVFQSKLRVSSSNQCNLHHSPHTGHLEKKNKKRVQSFSDTLYNGFVIHPHYVSVTVNHAPGYFHSSS
jgi:hypothetical protein